MFTSAFHIQCLIILAYVCIGHVSVSRSTHTHIYTYTYNHKVYRTSPPPTLMYSHHKPWSALLAYSLTCTCTKTLLSLAWHRYGITQLLLAFDVCSIVFQNKKFVLDKRGYKEKASFFFSLSICNVLFLFVIF